ncbi:hypothetical protein SMD44_p20049 (plasmid) [Streptomyces alboflavus]|uniref:Endonuclease/exonuclease/phosphatase domain-containing protein n=2 Tax=Streptomyces alboflavus TaxID=67267 RepID=A0A291W5L4_9ACTN|nr:hypothetical protein SMD44_p20049 [Streptomyces alboflavus]
MGSASASPAPSPRTFEIGTFNMAGGNKDYNDAGEKAVNALYSSIVDRSPAFVTVQEACEDWMEALDEKLSSYTIVFDPVTSGSGSTAQCKNEDSSDRSPFGNAVIYRKGLGFEGNVSNVGHSLGTTSGERREMLCVTSDLIKSVACSAHLSVDDAAQRERELRKALKILGDDYENFTHFLGGDFNATPRSEELEQIYHRSYSRHADGDYQEVDSPCGESMTPPEWSFDCRVGEYTHDDWWFEEQSPFAKKIDYLFVSPDAVTVNWADATTARYSDHDPLWASVTI